MRATKTPIFEKAVTAVTMVLLVSGSAWAAPEVPGFVVETYMPLPGPPNQTPLPPATLHPDSQPSAVPVRCRIEAPRGPPARPPRPPRVSAGGRR